MVTLSQFLAVHGDADVAAAVGVSRFACRSWRLGTKRPRIEHARRLVEFARKKGARLSLEGIYVHNAPVLIRPGAR